MSPTLDIKVDERQMREITELLAEVPRGVPRVVVRAINKVGVAARTAIVRRVVREVNLKTAYLREHNVYFGKARTNILWGRLRIWGNRVPLIEWGARQVKRGVSYAIRRGQRKVLEGAFMESHGKPIELEKRGRAVAIKTGPFRISRRLAKKTSKRKGRKKGMAYMVQPRKPITERFGPSVPQIVKDIGELGQQVLDEKIASDLAREVNTQVGLVLERHRSAKAAAAVGG